MSVQFSFTRLSILFLLLMVYIVDERVDGTLRDYRDAPGLGKTRFSENGEEFKCEARNIPVSSEPHLPSRVPIFDCNCYHKLSKVECPEWIELSAGPDSALRNEYMKGEGYCVASLKYSFPNSSRIHSGGTVVVHTKCEQSHLEYKSEEYFIKIKKAGNQENCYRDEDCYLKGQQCSGEGKCYCSPIWAAFSEEHACLPYSHLDGSCEQDIQCRFIPNANCSERNICECGPSYWRRDQFCISPIADDDPGGRNSTWLIPILVMLGILFLGGVAIAIYKWRSNVNRHHPVPVST